MPTRIFYLLFIFLSLYIFQPTAFADVHPLVCNKTMLPKIVKSLEDWSIIGGSNEPTSIATADAFSGEQLTYSTKCAPTNPANSIFIDPTTGLIKVKAVAKDKFDIAVTAKNNCGSATASFNVEIDVEE